MRTPLILRPPASVGIGSTVVRRWKKRSAFFVRGGALAIAHYSYLTEHAPVARETEELILEFNPSWNMAASTGIYPERMDELIHSGFRKVEEFCYHHDEEFSHVRWRGRIRTCNGVGSGGLSPSDVLRFDAALERLLANKYPDPMAIEHRVWCVIARNPV
jgi:hypothetical protein